MMPDRSTSPRGESHATTLSVATLLALSGALWLAWLSVRIDAATSTSTGLLTAAWPIAVLALPATALAVPMTTAALRRSHARRPSVLVEALAVAPVAALAVALAHQLGQVLFGGGAAALLPVIAMTADTVSLLVILVPVAVVALVLARSRPRAVPLRVRAALVTGVWLLVAAVPAGLAPSAASPATESLSCLSGGAVDRTYDVTALDVDITLNRFGDHDPIGTMYALTSSLPAIAAQMASRQVSIGLADDPIQPLVIRANEGECLEIRYTNATTSGDFGLHIDGLEFSTSSSGGSVGANPSSAVPQGQSRTYRFAIPLDPALEGGHYLHPGPGHRATVNHGLFGALVVEPPGSTYWNASTPSQPLLSGWEAIIKPMGTGVACIPRSYRPTCAFREAALLHHEIGNDNEQITDRTGRKVPLVDDTTGSYRPGAFALNYRSEPFRNRLLAFPREKAHSYSSYTFGEPATPMMRGYLADPTKIRLMHVGTEKFHVFHLHGGGDRWRADPLADGTSDYALTGLAKNASTTESPSNRLDSQSIGPGESYNLEIEGGAGGVQQSAGDFLFHCHIAKHYVSGMWALWRVYDTRQPDLVPLQDRTAPPVAVESAGLIGRTINGTRITAANLDSWIRPQLPPSGVPRGSQDATVWNWKIAGTPAAPRYLGAPADPTVFPGSPQVVPGQPNLLRVDIGHVAENRPAIRFNPLNGRPAYPLLRPQIGTRPPFTGGGHSGTPWLGKVVDQPSTAVNPYARRADSLCPAGRTWRSFNVVAIGVPIQRTPTLTDPDGKIFVLAKNKKATYATPAKAEPLAIRANQGDCIAITLTNEIPDASAFDKYSKSSMHIHHVQFDVQGSDGVTAGFAYEHSVRPYAVTDPKLVVAARAGDTKVRLATVSALIGTDANGKPTKPWIAIGEGLETIEIRQVASVDAATRTVTLSRALSRGHALGEYAGTEFVQYTWYPDAVLDNVFWHDHVDGIHGWGHGLVGQLIVEPPGSTYHDPVTGKEVDSGTLVDIHTTSPLSPGLVTGSFRELALWTIDDNDKGDYSTINLKANPLRQRLDKANQFSSWRYGDPLTPLPRLYADDPLVIRTINVSPALDTLHVVGGRTLLEHRLSYANSDGYGTADGTILDAVHYGVSEKYTLILNGDEREMRMRPGDYLYANGIEHRTQQGAWGIMRILPGLVDGLQPLPGVSTPSTTYVPPQPTGLAPPASAGPGDPCPVGAPVRRFGITAMDRSGMYAGGRTAFVPNADVEAVRRRAMSPSPLVLHAVAGECVQVDLTNQLLAPVGFAVGKVEREPGSGGVNVGYSDDQNVAPGATRRYVYYVGSDRIGTSVIADLAGATTLKNGLYGALVVAQKSLVPGESTQFSDPVTGRPKDIGAQVLVHVPGAARPDYRDFTVAIADDDATIGQDFMPYPTDADAGRSLINYVAAPPGDGPEAFRDPGQVPWLTSYAGDPVTVHAFVAPGSESGHVFGLGGLRWAADPFIRGSNSVSAQGMGPWESFTMDVAGGAGGTAWQAGDYFYGDMRRPFTAVGLWGLQRVLPAGTGSCPIRLVDGSTC